MLRLLLLALTIASLFAGCLDRSGNDPGALATADVVRDSSPIHEALDLTAGIDRDWSFDVAEPAGDQGLLRFVLSGPSGAPAHLGQVCLSYSMDQFFGNATRHSEGKSGVCGGAGNVLVAPSPQENVLFLLEGASVRPGNYRFHVEGTNQAASLIVDLVAR